MARQAIAIIGLGRIGSAFLGGILRRNSKGIKLVCAAERNDTPGKAAAAAAGVNLVTLDEVVALGDQVDVIFDLTGLPDVRHELREKLAGANNHHTVIASESIARVIWALINEDEMPEIPGRSIGY
jgi:pyrroline-5-carboxylate reductase